MKTKFLLLTLLITSVSTSFAQVSFGGGVHSSLAFSKPDPNGLYGLGFGWGAQGDMNIIPALAIRLNFDYHTFPLDKSAYRVAQQLPNFIEVQGGSIHSIGINVSLLGKLQTGSSVKPYGIFGLGIQFVNTSDARLANPQNGKSLNLTFPGSTNLGLNFGGGVEFAIGRRTKLFFDTKYVLIFASDATAGYIPLTFGVSF